jgi:peptidoglycan glycosyltransferase
MALLAFVGVLIGCAYTLASLGQSSSIPANIGPFLGVLFALFLIAHLGIRRLAPNASPLIAPLVVLLNGIGYVEIARLNPGLAGQQAAWTGVGILGFLGTLFVIRSVKTLEHYRFTIGLVGVVLLMMPMIPGVGVLKNGSRIWVRLGPISFQPGEFAKIALAIFLAGYLVERRELLRTATFRIGRVMIPDPKHLLPVLVAWGIASMVMMFERDLGSALLFFVLFITIMWLASERLSYLVIGFGLFGGAAYVAWTMFSHVQTRVSMWIDPWSDPHNKGFQIVQSAYAFAWGGLAGTGLGRGSGGRIPFQETDFIFAVIGEELGLAGTTAILLAFMMLMAIGVRTAVTLTNPFSKLLAAGLTTLIGFQAFIIMAGVTRLLPLTGVTLPFVSYGGSSLVSNWILLALLIRLSDEAGSQARDLDEATTALRVSV